MNKIAKLRIQSAIIQQCRCFYCGLAMIEPALPEFTPKELKPKLQKYLLCTAEHLTARKDQGRDTAQNIIAACWWCNTRRHKGRKENAPNPQQYRQRVQSLMKRGRWHPVSALAVAFRANDSELATLDASGLILAPMELVSALVCEYIRAGHDLQARRDLLAFALSVEAGRSLIAQLTPAEFVRIGDCSVTQGEAQDRIKQLQALLVF